MPIVALVVLAIIIVLIGLADFIYILTRKIQDVLDVKILGVRPFESIGNSLHNRLTEAVNAKVEERSPPLTNALHGLNGYLQGHIASLRAFGDAIEKGFVYTLSHEVPAQLKAKVDPLVKRIVPLETFRAGEAARRAEDQRAAFNHADSVASNAYTDSVRYTDSTASSTRKDLGSRITGIDTRVETVVYPAAQKAEQHATAALKDIQTLTSPNGIVATAAALATLPALNNLVRTTVSEAGLEDATCRAKVKGICGVSPFAWLQLLEGLALLEAGLNFRALVHEGRTLIHEAAPLIREVV